MRPPKCHGQEMDLWTLEDQTHRFRYLFCKYFIGLRDG